MRALQNTNRSLHIQNSPEFGATSSMPLPENAGLPASRVRATGRNMPARVSSSTVPRLLFGCISARSSFEEQLGAWAEDAPSSREKKARRSIAKKIGAAYRTNATSLTIAQPLEYSSYKHCYIDSLPACLGKLTKLKNLTIHLDKHSPIQFIPQKKFEPVLNWPPNLITLSVTGLLIDNLPALPITLETLEVRRCHISVLPELPQQLLNLSVVFSKIKPIDTCSQNSRSCDDRTFSELPELPPKLLVLSVDASEIKRLPTLPETLITLSCPHNELEFLPHLPPHLQSLDVYRNKLKVLPYLPQSLKAVNAHQNSIVGIDFITNRPESDREIPARNYRRSSTNMLEIVSEAQDIANKYKQRQLEYPEKILPQNYDNPHGLPDDILARTAYDKQLMTWVDNSYSTYAVNGGRGPFPSRRDTALEIYSGGSHLRIALGIEDEKLPANILRDLQHTTRLTLDIHLNNVEIPEFPRNLKVLVLYMGDGHPILPTLPETLRTIMAPPAYINEELRRLRVIAGRADVRPELIGMEENLGHFADLPIDLSEKILDFLVDDPRALVNLGATSSAFRDLLVNRVAVANAIRQVQIIERCI